jgi:uncharacterized membrane protein YeaQ/YmgE (transglycosylase-associated protein family)
MSTGFVIAILISGLWTGALARFALPGPDPMPIWLTLSIGLAGSIVGAVVGDASSNGNGYVISFVSLGVAIGLVAAYRHFVQRRPIFGPGARAFPQRGLGVAEQRERMRKLGVDPDLFRPDPQAQRRVALLAMLDGLHREGILDDDEYAEKRAAIEEQTAEEPGA